MVWFSVRAFASTLWNVGWGSRGIFFFFLLDKLFLCTLNKYSLGCWYEYNTAAHWKATRTSTTNINPTVCQWGLTYKNKVRSKSNRVKQQNTVSRRDKAYKLEQLWKKIKSFLTLGRLRSRHLGLVMQHVHLDSPKALGFSHTVTVSLIPTHYSLYRET